MTHKVAKLLHEETRVTATEIAQLAVRLCELGSEKYSDDLFRKKFAFAYDLLVDAEIQLQNVGAKIKQQAKLDQQ